MSQASERTPDELVDQLASEEAFERLAAFYTLEKIGPDAAIPAFIEGFDPNYQRILYTYRDLVKIWGPDAVPVLLEILENSSLLEDENNPDEYTRGWMAVDGLAEVGPDAGEAVTLLLQKLDEPYSEPWVLADLCTALDCIGDRSDEVIEALLRVLDDETPSLSPTSACYALGTLADPGDQRVIERLIQFRDKVYPVPNIVLWPRVLAARSSLYRLGWEQEENFAVIAEMAISAGSITDPDAHTAWKALVRIGDERAIGVLADAFTKSQDQVLLLGFTYLRWLGPRPDVIQILMRALDHPDLPVRFVATNVLGRFGPDASDALPALLEAYDLYKGEDEDELRTQLLTETEEAIIRISEGK